VRNILIVTPGKTIQKKTVANFDPGHPKFVPGAEYEPLVIHPENYAGGRVGDALHDPHALKVFIFNVQLLTKPTAKTSRAAHLTDEFIGTALYDHLREADDLVIIADEHHVYRSEAKKFHEAVRDLEPRALVGLTATPDEADRKVPGRVVFQYSLAEAIADGLVKIPVIVYREDGHTDIATQLADACQLRRVKEETTRDWAEQNGRPMVNPVLFVVCQSVAEATEVADMLAGPGFIGEAGAVLQITSGSKEDALEALAGIEDSDSPVRAVVSVNMLKEGWDVKNISVIVALRTLASETLTEQILGRGLRLPYGKRVGFSMIDTVDIIAHDSYRKLLAAKEALLEHVLPQKGQQSAARRRDVRDCLHRHGGHGATACRGRGREDANPAGHEACRGGAAHYVPQQAAAGEAGHVQSVLREPWRCHEHREALQGRDRSRPEEGGFERNPRTGRPGFWNPRAGTEVRGRDPAKLADREGQGGP
jgi:type III restriction enzyme